MYATSVKYLAILFLSVLLLSLQLYALEHDYESVFSTKHWKSIPIENTKAWEEFVQEMRNNNTSPYECIKKINEEKKRKALRKLFNAHELQEIQKTINSLENKSLPPLHFTFAPNIPWYVKMLVEANAQIMNMQGNINVCYGECNGAKSNDTGSSLVIHPNYYPAKFCFDISFISRQIAILQHEFMHIKKKHYEIDNNIWHYIKERLMGTHQNFILSGLHALYYEISTGRSLDGDINDLNKLCRAHESEADREHAAYGNGAFAKCAYLYWQFAFEERKNIPPEDLVDPIHPPVQKRLLWATLILKAKEAEYRLDHPYRTKIKELFFGIKKNIALCKTSIIAYLSFIKHVLFVNKNTTRA